MNSPGVQETLEARLLRMELEAVEFKRIIRQQNSELARIKSASSQRTSYGHVTFAINLPLMVFKTFSPFHSRSLVAIAAKSTAETILAAPAATSVSNSTKGARCVVITTNLSDSCCHIFDFCVADLLTISAPHVFYIFFSTRERVCVLS